MFAMKAMLVAVILFLQSIKMRFVTLVSRKTVQFKFHRAYLNIGASFKIYYKCMCPCEITRFSLCIAICALMELVGKVFMELLLISQLSVLIFSLGTV